MSKVIVEGEQGNEQQDEQNQESQDAQKDIQNSSEADESGGDADSIVVSIGDAEPEESASAPGWVKDLRQQHRESKKRIKELEDQLQSTRSNKSDAIGAKPTLESCDWDEARYETQLAGWYDKKRQVEERQRQEEQSKQRESDAWQAKLSTYGAAKQAMKVQDFEDAEETVLALLSQTQQGIIVKGAENSALVVYALGKNPSKAKELAEITDPVEFAVAVGRLEKGISMKPKQSAPVEKRPSGSGSFSGTTGGELDRLREEGMKTGDMSKVIAYKRQMRDKQRT